MSDLKNNEIDYGTVVMDNEEVVIAPTNYRKLMKNEDKTIRKEVYEKFHKSITKHSGTFASLLNSYVSMEDKIADIYNFKTSWDRKLFDYNISNKVYETLVKTTFNNLKPINRYFELKKKVLKKDKLKPYDLGLEIIKNDRKYTIEEAQDLIREAIKPLGDEYLAKYDKVINNRYVDYCQYKGKCSGGYSFSTINQDSRILLSFNDELDSVSTIAHEAGHNVHHQFVHENNAPQYRNPSSIVAEVVSLTNECLLSSYLVDNAEDKNEKLAGLSNILGVIVSNLFGAVREGKIEQEMYDLVHKGSSITRDFMDKITKKSLKKYYGNAVKLGKYSKNSWITRSHYYMHFYLYSYAICVSVALSVASKILKGDKDTLNRYHEFMKCGSDMWPKDVFMVLGVDLNDKKVYEEAIEYFNTLIDKYYKIMQEEVK